MRLRFWVALLAAMSAIAGLADGNELLAAFRDAVASHDVLECQRALKPLFDKVGTFNDVKTRDAVLLMVADRLPQLRIRHSDDAPVARFHAMENLMWYVAGCDQIAQTNVYFLKLADYLADEREISVDGRASEIKEAREKDRALIASGAIAEPIVYTAYPRTPNLLALRRKYDRIDRWNSAVKKHRSAVAFCFSRPMSRYLSTIKDAEGRSKFRRLFTERARLSPKEELRFFGTVSDSRNANANAHRQEALK
ncbi:MAG: hypothetical protein IJ146_01025 [Kiritimatiellae bacterium]|nr:hypothetical protein [Kiritimatiellia bacterium]